MILIVNNKSNMVDSGSMFRVTLRYSNGKADFSGFEINNAGLVSLR